MVTVMAPTASGFAEHQRFYQWYTGDYLYYLFFFPKAIKLFYFPCVSHLSKENLKEMGPKTDQKKVVAMQEARKEASPDWLAEGGIHSASNPNPGRANTDFDQRRLMIALVAHKTESKIPGPPDMTEREKSPVTSTETAKATSSPAHTAIRHALPEVGFLTGVWWCHCSSRFNLWFHLRFHWWCHWWFHCSSRFHLWFHWWFH